VAVSLPACNGLVVLGLASFVATRLLIYLLPNRFRACLPSRSRAFVLLLFRTDVGVDVQESSYGASRLPFSITRRSAVYFESSAGLKGE
jgi:hypothetical protein